MTKQKQKPIAPLNEKAYSRAVKLLIGTLIFVMVLALVYLFRSH